MSIAPATAGERLAPTPRLRHAGDLAWTRLGQVFAGPAGADPARIGGAA